MISLIEWNISRTSWLNDDWFLMMHVLWFQLIVVSWIYLSLLLNLICHDFHLVNQAKIFFKITSICGQTNLWVIYHGQLHSIWLAWLKETVDWKSLLGFVNKKELSSSTKSQISLKSRTILYAWRILMTAASVRTRWNILISIQSSGSTTIKM